MTSAVRTPVAIGAGIDADAIGALVDPVGDGVAVNDDEAMIAVIFEERLANPAQVGLPLLVELHPRPDPGMDDHIVAKAEAYRQKLWMNSAWAIGTAARIALSAALSLIRLMASGSTP